MSSNTEDLIAVVGATGQQGGAVVRTLQAGGQFKVRALSRHPDNHRELADEVFQADLNRPETLEAAFEGAHGVFLVTNFWEKGADELKQATAAVRSARDAGVKHFVWSTLPDAETISGGRFHVPHFTGKARIDRIVTAAGFVNHNFVIAPMYYQNLESRQMDPWSGLFLLIRMCSAFTWATAANWATSLLVHLRTRMRQAMANICRSLEIS
jgi:uncharacterized protein YbjT (DUF2867 family)